MCNVTVLEFNMTRTTIVTYHHLYEAVLWFELSAEDSSMLASHFLPEKVKLFKFYFHLTVITILLVLYKHEHFIKYSIFIY